MDFGRKDAARAAQKRFAIGKATTRAAVTNRLRARMLIVA
jgi:hypothetical protein